MSEEILEALRDCRPLLDGFGVARLSLFGSFARDEGQEDSDVDLLVEFSRPVGLFEFVRLQRELGACLGRPVELVTPALEPQLRDRILHEAVVAVQGVAAARRGHSRGDRQNRAIRRGSDFRQFAARWIRDWFRLHKEGGGAPAADGLYCWYENGGVDS